MHEGVQQEKRFLEEENRGLVEKVGGFVLL